ncbi:MAG: SDR family NAD(P)-dependent oxidoreductase, partial [Desulfurococcaceae archaeon]
MGLLSGKVAVVTGGARGIGAAIAYKLGAEGASVVIADVDEEAGAYRERWLRSNGVNALFIKADVSKEGEVASLFRKVEEKFGRLDALINNAGVANFKDFFEETLEDWYKVIDT